MDENYYRQLEAASQPETLVLMQDLTPLTSAGEATQQTTQLRMFLESVDGNFLT